MAPKRLPAPRPPRHTAPSLSIPTRPQAFCELEDGWGLATIHNKADNDAIGDMIGKEHVWIGFHDRVDEGKWGWDMGSSTYTNWRPGEPNQWGGKDGKAGEGDEDCAMIYRDQVRAPPLEAGCSLRCTHSACVDGVCSRGR